MNILYLSLIQFDDFKGDSIYHDTIQSLIDHRCNVTVVSPGLKHGEKALIKFDNNQILKVKTWKITKTKSKIKKGIATLLIEYQYLRSIKQHLQDVEFDLILYSTPPITFNKVIKYIKFKNNSISYLLLKDIFPQNAVDLNMMSKKSFIYKMFRKKEKELYKISDTIGCMSPGNINYLIKENPQLDKSKVELFPNSIKLDDQIIFDAHQSFKTRKKYGIDNNKKLFVYGGNLGKPQGIEFLIEVAKNFQRVKNGFLLIIGEGTEYQKIQTIITKYKLQNVLLFPKIEKQEYEDLLKSADVGLIFLDRRFTIPNFPSRLLSYMEIGLPILAATDINTDIGEIIVQANSGYWVESGNLEGFIKYANKLSKENEIAHRMGLNSRKYLEDNYDVDKNIFKILEKVRD